MTLLKPVTIPFVYRFFFVFFFVFYAFLCFYVFWIGIRHFVTTPQPPPNHQTKKKAHIVIVNLQDVSNQLMFHQLPQTNHISIHCCYQVAISKTFVFVVFFCYYLFFVFLFLRHKIKSTYNSLSIINAIKSNMAICICPCCVTTINSQNTTCAFLFIYLFFY